MYSWEAKWWRWYTFNIYLPEWATIGISWKKAESFHFLFWSQLLICMLVSLWLWICNQAATDQEICSFSHSDHPYTPWKIDHGFYNSLVIVIIQFLRWLRGEESACYAGDVAGAEGSIPASGRSPGEGNGNPLQYSCLGNPMDRGAWWTTIHGAAKRHDWTYTASISMIL